LVPKHDNLLGAQKSGWDFRREQETNTNEQILVTFYPIPPHPIPLPRGGEGERSVQELNAFALVHGSFRLFHQTSHQISHNEPSKKSDNAGNIDFFESF
jgi:hypothetical protein